MASVSYWEWNRRNQHGRRIGISAINVQRFHGAQYVAVWTVAALRNKSDTTRRAVQQSVACFPPKW